MKAPAVATLAGVLFLAACNHYYYTPSGQATGSPGTVSHFYGAEGSGLRNIDLNFSWKGVRNCSSTLPAFTVGNVPKGTRSLIFQLHNLSMPREMHGGTTINYTGRNEGLRGPNHSYKGPCVNGGTRKFRWVVVALDGLGETLGKGSAQGDYPPQ